MIFDKDRKINQYEKKYSKWDKNKLDSDKLINNEELTFKFEKILKEIQILNNLILLTNEMQGPVKEDLVKYENEILFLKKKTVELKSTIEFLSAQINSKNINQNKKELYSLLNIKLEQYNKHSNLLNTYTNKLKKIKQTYLKKLIKFTRLIDYEDILYKLLDYRTKVTRILKENGSNLLSLFGKEMKSIDLFIQLINNKEEEIEYFTELYKEFPLFLVSEILNEKITVKLNILSNVFFDFLQSKLVYKNSIKEIKKHLEKNKYLINIIINKDKLDANLPNWEEDFKLIHSPLILSNSTKTIHFDSYYSNSKGVNMLILSPLSKKEKDLLIFAIFLKPDLLPLNSKIYIYKKS